MPVSKRSSVDGVNGSRLISPFPSDIDRNIFGAWLSGFIDGEGTFTLALRGDTPRASFGISLRFDDASTLRLIQSYWYCGGVYVINRKKNEGARKQEVSFTVVKHDHLENILLLHFERYPLFAKKRRDLEIWRKGVLLMGTVHNRKRHKCGTSGQWGRSQKWLLSEVDEFRQYHDEIRRVRG